MVEKKVRLRAKLGDRTYGYDVTSITPDEWQAMLRGLDSLSERLSEVVRRGKQSGDDSVWTHAERDMLAVMCAAAILRRIWQLVDRTEEAERLKSGTFRS